MFQTSTPALSDLEKRALNAIDEPGLLDFIGQLVAVPSLDGEETPAQELMARQMASLGLETDVWEIDFDSLRRHPSYSAEVERVSGLGVAGWMGQGNLPTLVLNGHVDVVPTGEPTNWHYPPWQATLAGGNIYGRGALDMKGPLCCGLYAAKAIRDAGIQLKGKLLIQSVIGEEDGGCGTLATVLRGHTGDAAIVLEPTELMVAPAHAGALNFRVTVPGRAAHGAVRQEGVSAIEQFIPIYLAIIDLEKRRNDSLKDPRFSAYDLPYPICVGTIQGGNWASTVAESLTFEGRYGVAVGEDLTEARAQLETAVAEAASKDEWLRAHPPRLDWWGGQFEPAGIDVDHGLVQLVSKAHEDCNGNAPPVQGMTYGADMRLLVNEGNTPTILFGPGDVRKAHQPDEFVPVEELLAVVRTIVVSSIRFCGSI